MKQYKRVNATTRRSESEWEVIHRQEEECTSEKKKKKKVTQRQRETPRQQIKRVISFSLLFLHFALYNFFPCHSTPSISIAHSITVTLPSFILFINLFPLNCYLIRIIALKSIFSVVYIDSARDLSIFFLKIFSID